VSLARPRLQPGEGVARDEVRISGQAHSWRSPAGASIQVRFSWLECDPAGNRCSPLPGAHSQVIVPPQELQMVTLRGAVTATDGAGSTSVATSNFYYDMAGLAFNAQERPFVRRHPQYDPDQLRARYGLGPAQNGAGQTIVIPAVGRQHGLRTAVNHFSAHYGLPRTCRTSQDASCFQLVISHAGRMPTDLSRNDETEADVEWAHAVAPEARILVLQFGFGRVAALLEKIGRLGRAGRTDVVSDSWCDPCTGFHTYAHEVVYPHIAAGCHEPHLVCVQATGDHGAPASTPSNSPYVLAVGGTRFAASPDAAARREVPWQPSGSGDTDVPLPQPAWQRDADTGCGPSGGAFACGKRAVPDVSATAANVPVYRPVPSGFAWSYFYGTSLSTPLWAGLIALTDQALQKASQSPMGIDELHQVLYRGNAAAGLDDIPPAGWDWATGLGSPKAGIVDVLARAIERYRGQS
jgi:subtilase family serine protease